MPRLRTNTMEIHAYMHGQTGQVERALKSGE